MIRRVDANDLGHKRYSSDITHREVDGHVGADIDSPTKSAANDKFFIGSLPTTKALKFPLGDKSSSPPPLAVLLYS
jgi:hypothetical protein